MNNKCCNSKIIALQRERMAQLEARNLCCCKTKAFRFQEPIPKILPQSFSTMCCLLKHKF